MKKIFFVLQILLFAIILWNNDIHAQKRTVEKIKMDKTNLVGIDFQGQITKTSEALVYFKELYIVVKHPGIKKILELNHYKTNLAYGEKTALCAPLKINYMETTGYQSSTESFNVIQGARRETETHQAEKTNEANSITKIGYFGYPLSRRDVYRLDSNTLALKLNDICLLDGGFLSVIILGSDLKEIVIEDNAELYKTQEIWETKHIKEWEVKQLFSQKIVTSPALNLSPLEEEKTIAPTDQSYFDPKITEPRRITTSIFARDTVYKPWAISSKEKNKREVELTKQLEETKAELQQVVDSLKKHPKSFELRSKKKFLEREKKNSELSLKNLDQTLITEQRRDYGLKQDMKISWLVRFARIIDYIDSVLVDEWGEPQGSGKFNATFKINIDTIYYQNLQDRNWYGMPHATDKNGVKIYTFNTPLNIYNFIAGITGVFKSGEREMRRNAEIMISQEFWGLKIPNKDGIEEIATDVRGRLVRFVKTGTIKTTISGRVKN